MREGFYAGLKKKKRCVRRSAGAQRTANDSRGPVFCGPLSAEGPNPADGTEAKGARDPALTLLRRADGSIAAC